MKVFLLIHTGCSQGKRTVPGCPKLIEVEVDKLIELNKIIENVYINSQNCGGSSAVVQIIPNMMTPTAAQLFVRWDKSDDNNGTHIVELVQDSVVVQTHPCGNVDRVFGYCQGIVQTLKRIGVSIEMPKCLTNRHICPNFNCED